MLPGFTGQMLREEINLVVRPAQSRSALHRVQDVSQGVMVAGIPNLGCQIKSYCSVFTSRCYWECDGRPVSDVWDCGWCSSW